MNRLPPPISGISGTASRFGGMAAHMLQDRLELLGLELREAKIRFIQALLLACIGVVFTLLGLVLAVLAILYFLPLEWRLYGVLLVATLSLLVGAMVFIALRRRLVQKPLAFHQSLTELQKDASCFSTRT